MLEPEEQSVIEEGRAFVKDMPWPICARFDLNPRTSHEEEEFLRISQGVVADPVALLRALRGANLSLTTQPPACRLEVEHDPHIVEWPDCNGDLHDWRCGGAPLGHLRPPLASHDGSDGVSS